MRMCWIPLALAVSAPAWAQETPTASLGIDVTELTVTGRGGVQTMVVHQALSVLDDVTRECYATAQAKAPRLAGTIAVRFKLDPSGAVSNVAVTGMPSVNACLVAAIKGASFYGPGKGPIELRQTVHLSVLARQANDAPQAGILGTMSPTEGGAFASLTGTGDLSSGFDDPSGYGGLVGAEAGSGDRGGGTIGAARYGAGVAGGRVVPTVTIGQPDSQGDLDKAIIRRYIKRNLQKLQYCYEKQLVASPKLAGTVTARFTIASNGQVTGATASGLASAEVNACVADVIKAIEFPRPKSGEVVVRYPFVFRAAKSP